jgi:hypothetical protein
MHRMIWFAAVLAAGSACSSSGLSGSSRFRAERVLLVSIDGLHEVDLERFVREHPDSALSRLSRHGFTYTEASTSVPSDSFPGLTAIVTGGSPATTGIWYDDSYDRELQSASGKRGARALFDDTVSKNPKALDGGGGIDPKTLPIDPKTRQRVFPHDYLRVNTIFEVARAHGFRTAWTDKHLAYDLVSGPSGRGVDDLYNLEIGKGHKGILDTEEYDDLKLETVLHEIRGLDHAGEHAVGVPGIFGMNIQAVSVAQKLKVDPTDKALLGGYRDGAGTPQPGTLHALEHTDRSIGRLVDLLRGEGLLDSTLIIITAKHGQSPIDPEKRVRVDEEFIPKVVNGVRPGLLAHAIQDTMPILWLTDRAETRSVVLALETSAIPGGVLEILWGESLQKRFHCDPSDSRTPDIIVVPTPGALYGPVGSKKIAEHGGPSRDDTRVALLVSNPRLESRTESTPVRTAQIGPTILRALGLDPAELRAVQAEHTEALPGF